MCVCALTLLVGQQEGHPPRNSPRQTVHTHRASVHQAAKLVAALLRVARVIVGLAEMSAYHCDYDSRHLQVDCQELVSAPVIEYGLPLPCFIVTIYSVTSLLHL